MQKNKCRIGKCEMYNEINITLSNKKHKVFFMNGFLASSNKTASNLHKHNFAEIHFVTGGDAVFIISENKLTLESGSIMIIPQGEYHCCIKKDSKTQHNAFQVDFEAPEVKKVHIGSETVSNFFDEINLLRSSGDYSKVASYVGLFCSYLCDVGKSSASAVSDYGFIIHEFISMNYNKNIHLCDLANELHLSERQTERLVVLNTGNSFREEVQKNRIKVAETLVQSTNMSLSEIASYVGYESYAGFYKALKKGG